MAKVEIEEMSGWRGCEKPTQCRLEGGQFTREEDASKQGQRDTRL